jgi:hypothetical protein
MLQQHRHTAAWVTVSSHASADAALERRGPQPNHLCISTELEHLVGLNHEFDSKLKLFKGIEVETAKESPSPEI